MTDKILVIDPTTGRRKAVSQAQALAILGNPESSGSSPQGARLYKNRGTVAIPAAIGAYTLMTVPAGKIRIPVISVMPPTGSGDAFVRLLINGIPSTTTTQFVIDSNPTQILAPNHIPIGPGDVLALEVVSYTGSPFAFDTHFSWLEYDTTDYGYAAVNLNTLATPTVFVPTPAPGKCHRMLNERVVGNMFAERKPVFYAYFSDVGGTIRLRASFYDGFTDTTWWDSFTPNVIGEGEQGFGNVPLPLVLDDTTSIRLEAVSGSAPTNFWFRTLYKIEDA